MVGGEAGAAVAGEGGAPTQGGVGGSATGGVAGSDAAGRGGEGGAHDDTGGSAGQAGATAGAGIGGGEVGGAGGIGGAGMAGASGSVGGIGGAGMAGASGSVGGIAGSGGSPTCSVAGASGSAGTATGGAGACASSCLEEFGPNACGDWTCDSTGECIVLRDDCADRDGDGFGVGPGCTCSPDCDDSDSDVTSSKVVPCCRTGSGTKTCSNGVWGACTAGFQATAEACDGEDDDCDGVVDNGLADFSCGTGACKVTVPACVAGVVSSCVPAAPASSVDGCNEMDDDCDGAVDEDCSACLRVAPDGDDAAAAASSGRGAFRNVQAAIDFAATHPEIAARVCVAAGSVCGATAVYAGPCAGLTMRPGIDVLGGYESATWTRCTNSTTRLAPQTGAGVSFPDDIDVPTVLDGFAIDRFAASSTAGVTVDGARQVTLSNLEIVGGPFENGSAVASVSYGVNVTNGGQATILRSRVDGGFARDEAVGVRSVGAQVLLEDNCPSTGCPLECREAWIRGHTENWPVGRSEAVVLDTSPGSRIERSAVCAYWDGLSTTTNGIRITGDASGVVIRGSRVGAAFDYPTGAGLRLESCAGAAPWIVDNAIFAEGEESAFNALVAEGDCHPVIDSNSSVSAHVRGRGSATALRCGATTGVASRCVIEGNGQVDVRFTWPPPSIGPLLNGHGVVCTGGACTKVSRNSIMGSSAGGISCAAGCDVQGTGVEIAGGEVLVDDNRISGGSTSRRATGMIASGRLRIQNNVIDAGLLDVVTLRGNVLYIALLLGGGRLDVHSNTIFVNPSRGNERVTDMGLPCTYWGIRFDGADSASFQNNRFHTGACPAGYMETIHAFRENTPSADPTIFEHNSLDGYLDEGTTHANPNLLTDMIASGNIARCEGMGWSLVSGSTCIDAGTRQGAPVADFDGELRDALPDIGCDEF
jgi:hypothetical protein